jgi:hypothetical protein
VTTKLLIYETAVPVSKTQHAKWSVEVGSDYAFSRNVNAVPLMAVEFPSAAGEYAVVFAGDEKEVMPAVILGVRDRENLYLAKEGGWRARYIPAFVRRYPFVFSSPDDGKTFTLCIDEGFSGFNKAGRGERLFDDQGKPSPYVDNVLKFLQQYQMEFRRTQAFCQKLRELNLLEPMRAQMTLGSGERMALSGFMAVDRARLKTLGAERLAELAKTDELELVYTHLQSLRNFAAMRERLAGAQAVDPEPKRETETDKKADKPAKKR